MTKQTEALLIPLIAIIYFALTKRSVRFLISKHFAMFLGVALLIFAPWLIHMNINFSYNFWNSYFLYHTFTRAVSPIESHTGSYLYYFNYLATNENLLWIVLLPFATGLSAYSAIKKRSKGDILVVTWIAIVLLVFTVVQTKLYYYILPVYPAFALAIGALLYLLANKMWQLIRKRKNHPHT
jgi:4-amino-4-deoxy-L-arabinose transferase-like glycosyltransferase